MGGAGKAWQVGDVHACGWDRRPFQVGHVPGRTGRRAEGGSKHRHPQAAAQPTLNNPQQAGVGLHGKRCMASMACKWLHGTHSSSLEVVFRGGVHHEIKQSNGYTTIDCLIPHSLEEVLGGGVHHLGLDLGAVGGPAQKTRGAQRRVARSVRVAAQLIGTPSCYGHERRLCTCCRAARRLSEQHIVQEVPQAIGRPMRRTS